jgi:uncharacterized membrane protein (UPF0127 family)
MIIKNISQKTILSSDARVCSSLWQKARGLMFSPQKDLVFVSAREQKIPLHMFFVFYPIDVLYLNKEKKVVECKENFLPFTFYNPQHKAHYVVELAVGTIKKTKTTVTDSLVFL